ncbi:hypothetical protein A2U01_0102488, partial [Trifolium medium]|nr:hypothetical protein [Trifolium medium]
DLRKREEVNDAEKWNEEESEIEPEEGFEQRGEVRSPAETTVVRRRIRRKIIS